MPEDILNIGSLLFSRELLEQDYPSLKELYLNLKNDTESSEERHNFLALLMQHFPYQSLKDLDLRNEIISNIDLSHIGSMFTGDIKCFFGGTFKYLKEFGMSSEENKKLVQNLFYYFSKSKFKESVVLQKYIKKIVLKNRLDRSIIFDIAKEKASVDTIYLDWLKLVLE